MIDPDMKELADALKGLKVPESNLSIGWATVIGIFVIILSTLFGGWISNKMDIVELKTQFKTIISWQEEVKPIIKDIRDDQKRRENNERK